MDKQIMWAALLFVAGWLWYYFFARQIVFNLTTVLPMINRFKKADKDLISVNANRLCIISCIVWLIICGASLALIIHFMKLYLWLSFIGGGIIGVLTYITRYGPTTKSNFSDFCATYYRFVPDDMLRTAMYNNKISEMKVRLDEMGIDKTLIIPEFKHEK